MYKTGHYGMALILYAPIALALVAFHQIIPAIIAGFIIVGLTRIPDWDLKTSLVKHRGITHTIVFTFLMGLLIGTVCFIVFYMLPPELLRFYNLELNIITLAGSFGFGFLTGSVSIVAHLLADVITPTGIQPFLPFKDKKYTFSWTTAANPVANAALFAVGVGLTIGGWVAGLIIFGATTPELFELLNESQLFD